MISAAYTHVKHTFEPVYDKNSKILILGSLPSVKSREQNFYYGHPQNRFWKLISRILGEPIPQTIEEKTSMLLVHNIAIWDVISECDIRGSSDASVRNVIPADINRILNGADIQCILANGSTAYNLYDTYCRPLTGRACVKCPSTSPANAAYSLDRLTEIWSAALSPHLGKKIYQTESNLYDR